MPNFKEQSWLSIAVIVAALMTLVVSVAARFFYWYVWDDALMFPRYADNLLQRGVLAWNPGGPPTFGLTSNLYLLIVVPVRILFATSPILTMFLASVVCGVIFVGLLIGLVARETPLSVNGRLVLVAVILIPLAFNANNLARHFTSGMDTAFALAYLMLYIWLAVRFQRAFSRGSAIALGVAGGLAFAARPDLLLFTWLAPLAMALFGMSSKLRRAAWEVLALTVAITLAQMVGAFFYFGSPLPLSFFVKTAGLYGSSLSVIYHDTPSRMLWLFTQGYALVLAAAAVWLLFEVRKGIYSDMALERGLAYAAVLFILYYWFSVTQLMPFEARFYYPVLPALLWLAVCGIVATTKWLQANDRWWRWGQLAPSAVLVAGYIMLLTIEWGQLDILRNELDHGRIGDFRLLSSYGWYQHLWFKLPEFAQLPDDLVIATTDVGLPAALNPRKTIVDLAGLNETQFALTPFSAERLFAQYRPDLIYLPNLDFKERIAAIVNAPEFIAHYDLLKPEEMAGGPYGLGVAIRRDGRYASQLRTIAAAAPDHPLSN